MNPFVRWLVIESFRPKSIKIDSASKEFISSIVEPSINVLRIDSKPLTMNVSESVFI